MPRNVNFNIPFEVWTNPDLANARQRHAAWLLSSGLLPGSEFSGICESWDFPALVAYACPDAPPARLDTAIKALTFSFVWDDQYERLCIQDKDKALAHAREMISIVNRPRGPITGETEVSQVARIWTALWEEMSELMSFQLLARMTFDFTWCIASFPHQAHDQLLGVPDLQHYNHLRRGVAGVDATLDMLEAIWACEPPVVAYHGPQLGAIRESIALATIWCNDVYSLEKEEADGDVDNLVLVVENARGCSRQEALDEIVAMVNQEMARFERATQQLPALYAYLDLTPQEQHTIQRWVQMHTAWMGGYHRWEQTTPRYAGIHAPGGHRMPIENLV